MHLVRNLPSENFVAVSEISDFRLKQGAKGAVVVNRWLQLDLGGVNRLLGTNYGKAFQYASVPGE